jgi:hypothetical protein
VASGRRRGADRGERENRIDNKHREKKGSKRQERSGSHITS